MKNKFKMIFKICKNNNILKFLVRYNILIIKHIIPHYLCKDLAISVWFLFQKLKTFSEQINVSKITAYLKVSLFGFWSLFTSLIHCTHTFFEHSKQIGFSHMDTVSSFSIEDGNYSMFSGLEKHFYSWLWLRIFNP